MVQRKDSVWLRENLIEEYHHTEKPGLKYNIMLDESLRNDVITKIAYYMLAQCNMTEDITHKRYHQVNNFFT